MSSSGRGVTIVSSYDVGAVDIEQRSVMAINHRGEISVGRRWRWRQ